MTFITKCDGSTNKGRNAPIPQVKEQTQWHLFLLEKSYSKKNVCVKPNFLWHHVLPDLKRGLHLSFFML